MKTDKKIEMSREFSLPELIRDYRMYHKLSQTQFGELLGVSHAAVSDMERGRTRSISPELFILLVDYIKTTPSHDEIKREAVKDFVKWYNDVPDYAIDMRIDTDEVSKYLTQQSLKGLEDAKK